MMFSNFLSERRSLKTSIPSLTPCLHLSLCLWRDTAEIITHAQVYKCPLSWCGLKNGISNMPDGCEQDLWWGCWAEYNSASDESSRGRKTQWKYNECVYRWRCWPYSWANWSPSTARVWLVGQIKKLNTPWSFIPLFQDIHIDSEWDADTICPFYYYLNWELLINST